MIWFYVLALVLVTAGAIIAIRGSDRLKFYFCVFLFGIGIGSVSYYLRPEYRSFSTFPFERILLDVLILYFVLTIWAFTSFAKLREENRSLSSKVHDYEYIKIPCLQVQGSQYRDELTALKREKKEAEEQPIEISPMPGTYVSIAEYNAQEALISKLKGKIRSLENDYGTKAKECDALWSANEALKKEIVEMNHRSIHDLRFETWGSILQRHGADRYNLSDKDYASLHYPTLNPDAVYYAAATGKCYHSVPWCYTLDTAARVYKAPLREVENDYRPCSFCVCLPKS